MARSTYVHSTYTSRHSRLHSRHWTNKYTKINPEPQNPPLKNFHLPLNRICFKLHKHWSIPYCILKTLLEHYKNICMWNISMHGNPPVCTWTTCGNADLLPYQRVVSRYWRKMLTCLFDTFITKTLQFWTLITIWTFKRGIGIAELKLVSLVSGRYLWCVAFRENKTICVFC